MHWQCFLVSRDKINRAFAAFFNGELRLSHHFPAFSNAGFAVVSGFDNKRGWRIGQAGCADVLDFELLILEEEIFKRFNPGRLGYRALVAPRTGTQCQTNAEQDENDYRKNNNDSRGRHGSSL
jgi:hypothetical protein